MHRNFQNGKTPHGVSSKPVQVSVQVLYGRTVSLFNNGTLLCQKFAADFEKSLLLFSIMWLDFRIWIITTTAKQEVPTKIKCTQYAIWLYYWLHMWQMCCDQYVWKWKDAVLAHGSKSPPYTILNYTTAKQQPSRVNCHMPTSWLDDQWTHKGGMACQGCSWQIVDVGFGCI